MRPQTSASKTVRRFQTKRCLFPGYNCSLFAYGQTGAGKSYSMMGYGEDKGIIPMACERIFDRIGSNTDPDLTIRVEASMLEIYMEKVRRRAVLIHRIRHQHVQKPRLAVCSVKSSRSMFSAQIRDLFNPTDGVDLKVRNHPKLGFYVQDLTRNAVSNYEQISDVGFASSCGWLFTPIFIALDWSRS